MKYRKRMRPSIDKKVFRKTADRGKVVNLNPGVSRGGILF